MTDPREKAKQDVKKIGKFYDRLREAREKRKQEEDPR